MFIPTRFWMLKDKQSKLIYFDLSIFNFEFRYAFSSYMYNVQSTEIPKVRDASISTKQYSKTTTCKWQF